jgi:phosphatidylserine/phosphatidylglycerophosphate/cardiolipin synthase-like enzyme
MQHNHTLSLCIVLTCLALAAVPSSHTGDDAQARYIPCRDYGPTLVDEINKARTSITAYLYLFALYPNRTESQTMRIASALAAAKTRGVRVEVVLDGGAFAGGDPVEALQADNREAYEFLRAQGIDVFFDDTGATLHAKAVVIDSQTVIAGSANWSEAALVYKDADFRAVEQFIGLEERYGREKVGKAASIIAKKAADNPHRSVGYFVGTVMSLP